MKRLLSLALLVMTAFFALTACKLPKPPPVPGPIQPPSPPGTKE